MDLSPFIRSENNTFFPDVLRVQFAVESLKIDAKTDIVPKLLKKAEAPSAETWHWPRPLDS